MSSDQKASSSIEVSTDRHYKHERTLKYGVNPHQHPASILSIQGEKFPFQVLNGNPGYINLLDALNSWQLVKELRQATGLAAAASFKHVSPAGAAVAAPLSKELADIYDVGTLELTPSSLAYLRARQADPKCSFGDWAALSDVVDESTALFLKREVSDGIIAPGFDPKALEILKSKKNGGYIILQADMNYIPPPIEYRELYGVAFAQHRNNLPIKPENFKVVTTGGTTSTLPESAVRDLLIASITAKYTQSNSVCYALDGQVVGVGAGQQSRVDCVKLAGNKVETWWLRQHPKVKSLLFKDEVKRTDRVNARIQYIEGGFSGVEKKAFDALFTSVPELLSVSEKEEWGRQLKGVSLSSDAFFPFRDNVDQAAKRGVAYIAQPGGSVQDDTVIAAANEYGITMAFTNIRLFHH